jgi:hypothetical protein
MAEDEKSELRSLAELNETFRTFTDQVLRKLDQILEMRETVRDLCESRLQRRQAASDRKRKHREGCAARLDLVIMPGDIWRRDDRLRKKYLEWAHIGLQFGLVGDWRLYLQYLADDWNNHTYRKKPLAKISNRLHRWDHGLRHEGTWCDMFGSERQICGKNAAEIGWWKFKWHFSSIVSVMRRLPLFGSVHADFLTAIRVMLGDLHTLYDEDNPPCIGPWVVGGLDGKAEFAHDMPPESWSKVPEFSMVSMHVLQSFRRGLHKPVDPDLELVRMGKAACTAHLAELEKRVLHLHFWMKLTGKPCTGEKAEERDSLEDFGVWRHPVNAPSPPEKRLPSPRIEAEEEEKKEDPQPSRHPATSQHERSSPGSATSPRKRSLCESATVKQV